MPKINEYYIKTEIKKPVENYELKDEYQVPSFEEFMKSYEVDEKLNYGDLSGGGVGEVKGCGPCIVNDRVIVDANCRCSDEEIARQVRATRIVISNRRFRAVFKFDSGIGLGFFVPIVHIF